MAESAASVGASATVTETEVTEPVRWGRHGGERGGVGRGTGIAMATRRMQEPWQRRWLRTDPPRLSRQRRSASGDLGKDPVLLTQRPLRPATVLGYGAPVYPFSCSWFLLGTSCLVLDASDGFNVIDPRV